MTTSFPLWEFVAGQLRSDRFPHRAHVEAAFALLQTEDFAEAIRTYVRAITTMALAAGHPEKFNMTVTVAMLSAIAERMPADRTDFDAFACSNPELFDRDFLLNHYSKERMQCDLARRIFLLPDRTRD